MEEWAFPDRVHYSNFQGKIFGNYRQMCHNWNISRHNNERIINKNSYFSTYFSHFPLVSLRQLCRVLRQKIARLCALLPHHPLKPFPRSRKRLLLEVLRPANLILVIFSRVDLFQMMVGKFLKDNAFKLFCYFAVKTFKENFILLFSFHFLKVW